MNKITIANITKNSIKIKKEKKGVSKFLLDGIQLKVS